MRRALRWPAGTDVRHRPIRGGAILYDPSRVGNVEEGWFDPRWWEARHARLRASAEGRGAALFIDAPGRRLVLRHYRRGGFIARLSADRYLWRDAASTRSLAEWHLLYLMRSAGLPVPAPIAACYRRVGGYAYTADLLTEQIEGVRSLASLLPFEPLGLSGWIAIGRCLRRFHDDGVCHPDLNAHNVLLGEGGQIWLVDFDRGRLRRPGWWCDANLVRLRRSIEKIAAPLPCERFSEADWASLLDAYFASSAPRTPEPAG